MLDSLVREFRFAARRHARKPSYFVIGVLILALGTGVVSVVFHLINAMLLRPLAAHEPAGLFRLYAVNGDARSSRFSYPDYLDYSRKTDVLQGLAASNLTGIDVRGYGQSLAEVVTANYFNVLGLPMQVGRGFSDQESEPVVVLSHRAWIRWFQSDPQIIGRQIVLNGSSFTVCGVMNSEFQGIFPATFIDAWVSFRQVKWLGANGTTDRDSPILQLIGRRQKGISNDQVAAALTTTAVQIEKAFPRKIPRTAVNAGEATLLHGNLRKGVSFFLTFMLIIAALVLLTATANLGNIALVHAAARKREFAIRLALGSGFSGLLRQFLMEGMLIAFSGAVAGFWLAHWASGTLLRLNPIPSVPLDFDFTPDYRIVLFQVVIAILASFVLGLIPALGLSRSGLIATIKEESSGSTAAPGRQRMRKVLVATQVAVSLALLIAAGLFIRSLNNAREFNPGFDASNAIAMDVDLSSELLSDADGLAVFTRMIQDIQIMPGISSITLSDLAPLDIATSRISMTSPDSEKEMLVSTNTIGTNYFQTMEIRLLQGRDFQEQDRVDSQPVVIINEAMADRFWKGKDAIGRSLHLKTSMQPLTVIAIAKNVKYRTLGEDPEPHIYLPFSQHYSPSMTILARVKSNPEAMIVPVQQQVSKSHATATAFFARTLEQHMGFSLLPARLAATLAGLLGVITLIIACCGIYGSAGYAASLRAKEIGIRMALGALPRVVLMLEMKRAAGMIAVGLLVGAGLAFLISRSAGSFLYGISPVDPLTYISLAALLATVAGISIYLPARRAIRIDPLRALRQE